MRQSRTIVSIENAKNTHVIALLDEQNCYVFKILLTWVEG